MGGGVWAVSSFRERHGHVAARDAEVVRRVGPVVGQIYKVVIPRCAGLENSYVHEDIPDLLSETTATIFLAGFASNVRHPHTPQGG